MANLSRKSFNNRYKHPNDNPDHARRRHKPAPSDAEIEQRLNDLVKPAVFAEVAHYRLLGMRNRILTLPVMVAAVLALLWRHIPGISELQRVLATERVLWTEPTAVSQPALSERFLTFPAELFERVLMTVLTTLTPRVAQRTRPLPVHLAPVQARFTGCYAFDGTTLEALFRKLHALQENLLAPLAGHLMVVVDLVSHLPQKIWCEEDPQTNDKTFSERLRAWLPENSLSVFDLGFFSFPFFDMLTASRRWFVTRLRAKTSWVEKQVLYASPQIRDRIVQLGKYRSNPSQYPVRLIEVQVHGTWHQYVTNVLDPRQLRVVEVVALYEQRWQIESAFLLVKRLLQLSYLWVGSINGVQLQVWATWLYYALLIDLCDDVAEVLQLPLQRISVEMVERGLYYYVGAKAQGYAGSAAAYFAEPKNRDLLGIVKRKRKTLALAAEVALLMPQPT